VSTANRQAGLSRTAVAVLAVAAGGAIANDYALQPSLPDVARDFGVPVQLITTVASAALIGYLVGLALLVPLVDRVSPRVLIPSQMAALALALVLAAAAPGPGALIAGFLLVGAATTVAAQCSAIVGKHTPPERRARSMGAISAGISAGILLSRFVGGVLTQYCGWRGALLVFAGFAVLTGLAARSLVPVERPVVQGGYLATLRAMPLLLRESADLRRRACAGMLWFFAFNLVWVGLAIRLAAPPYHLSAAAIGLYSLAGVLGLAVTRVAGRLSDRFGSRAVIVVGLTAAALCALALAAALGHPVWTAIALAVFDAGCFAAQVANQAGVVAIGPARAGALSAAYLTLYYVAGAIGTAVAGTIVAGAGWTAVAIVAAAAVVVAAIIGSTARTAARVPSGQVSR
jgi:predicted MFS family arabinose efflux permease